MVFSPYHLSLIKQGTEIPGLIRRLEISGLGWGHAYLNCLEVLRSLFSWRLSGKEQRPHLQINPNGIVVTCTGKCPSGKPTNSRDSRTTVKAYLSLGHNVSLVMSTLTL